MPQAGIELAGAFPNRQFAARLSVTRNTQLDGWRAFAVAGVMWHHWAPKEWRGHFPFEIGLFFFLTLTGFLITGVLLRERSALEASGSGKGRAYLHFQKRRMMRILIPCYVAMLFAIFVGASDIRAHWEMYFLHLSNFHMAFMNGWPSGTAHYWTLAIQMQFYLVWPLVVFFLPRKSLGTAFIVATCIAPLSRLVISTWFPAVHHADAISLCALDYFGVGALLALAMDRGMKPGDVRLRNLAWVACVAYLVLYGFYEAGRPLPGLKYIQQTLVSVMFAGLISGTIAGFRGAVGTVLEHPAIQHIGRLSYGLYLFHTPVPLLLGWITPQLWSPFFSGYLEIIPIAVFAVVSWGIAWMSWRFLESKPVRAHRHTA